MSGCGAQETFETVSDSDAVQVVALKYQLQVSLPEEAAISSMESNDDNKIYLCDGYALTVQKLSAGDLDRTLREITGFGADALTVMQTRKDGFKQYECVWAAAGENEDQVGRATILDDGTYHHAVTVMAGYTQAGDLQSTWQDIMDSATLVSTD